MFAECMLIPFVVRAGHCRDGGSGMFEVLVGFFPVSVETPYFRVVLVQLLKLALC